METVVVAGNGKILIPLHFRKKYHLEAGCSILLIERDNELILRPLTANYIKSLRGILKGGNLAEDFKANRKEEFGLELKKSRKLKIHAEK
ncbi:MAG: AbrB/MazE/SpoVT family DNA-binding domain-containing protein [Saprospiraceae bacterium]|nr:AbrB/MazE/SpoVT family DNA-binding domain-containing protein [Saprospiraceae bacterium]